MKKLLLFLMIVSALPAHAQLSEILRPIVVDHNSVARFDQIPAEYLTRAQNIRALHVDRSVITNFNDALNCLQYASTAVALNSCKRWGALPPELWSQSYPRPNWVMGTWPGSGMPNPLSCPGVSMNGYWDSYQSCFMAYLNANLTSYDVAWFQFDYLITVASGSSGNINNYFQNLPGVFDVYDFQALEPNIAPKRLVYVTTSLAHGVWDSAQAASFNQSMRELIPGSPRALFDVADIISHLPNGMACIDSQFRPVICTEYTAEANGGHWGGNGFDVGKIRVAKAYWVFMACMSGWDACSGFEPPPPPPPQDTTAPVGSTTCTRIAPSQTQCVANFTDNVHLNKITWKVESTAWDDAGNHATDTDEYEDVLP